MTEFYVPDDLKPAIPILVYILLAVLILKLFGPPLQNLLSFLFKELKDLISAKWNKPALNMFGGVFSAILYISVVIGDPLEVLDKLRIQPSHGKLYPWMILILSSVYCLSLLVYFQMSVWHCKQPKGNRNAARVSRRGSAPGR